MDRQKIEEFYDRLCFALTAYECRENVSEQSDYDFGVALYNDIVDIVNDIAAALN